MSKTVIPSQHLTVVFISLPSRGACLPARGAYSEMQDIQCTLCRTWHPCVSQQYTLQFRSFNLLSRSRGISQPALRMQSCGRSGARSSASDKLATSLPKRPLRRAGRSLAEAAAHARSSTTREPLPMSPCLWHPAIPPCWSNYSRALALLIPPSYGSY